MLSNKKKILLYMLDKGIATVDEIRTATNLPPGYSGVYLYNIKKEGYLEHIKYGTYKITEKGTEKANRIKDKLAKKQSQETKIIDDKSLTLDVEKRAFKNKKSVDLKDLKLIKSLKEKYGKNKLLEIIEVID